MEFIRSIYENYRDMDTLDEKESFLRSTAILCPTNSKADNVNESLIRSDILGDAFALQEPRIFTATNSFV